MSVRQVSNCPTHFSPLDRVPASPGEVSYYSTYSSPGLVGHSGTTLVHIKVTCLGPLYIPHAVSTSSNKISRQFQH